jgi:subtilisin family serine protease
VIFSFVSIPQEVPPVSIRVLRVFIFIVFLFPAAFGQQISDSALQQMRDMLRMKQSLTPAQSKESFNLIVAGMRARHQSSGTVADSIVQQPGISAQGMVLVDIKANSLGGVLQRIAAVAGQVVYSSSVDREIRANLPLLSVDTVAAHPDVRWVRAADTAHTNVGAVTSQGYVTHLANQAVALGFDGTGVRVGVLSDSASPARVASLIASGDLPNDVTVVPGQASSGTDEGTAIMEIVHDLAPGAKLFFATANGGQSNFANNIRALRFTYGCDIILDDIAYFAEGAFQDGTVARAVNDVVANGALYFSAAGNSGNLTSGTSGIWEGDFAGGGDAGTVIDIVEGKPVTVHNFGNATNPQLYNVLTRTSTFISLKWSDPLASSSSDYDLFILDAAGTTVKGVSLGAQTGTQDPYEAISQGSNCGTASASGYCPSAGDRIVVVLYSGAPRALRLDTNRGTISISTTGSTFGHNAGLNTISTAATYWNSAHSGTLAFTGPQNPIEPFSSDGPRKIFYNPNGVAITPGNVLFGTNGGTTLQKPDVSAADGVFTKTPGFLPFFGTSAAAPHAAAVAALVKSANPALTNTQIKQILTTTAVDDMAPGVDRDSGFGIVMALAAVQAALSAP